MGTGVAELRATLDRRAATAAQNGQDRARALLAKVPQAAALLSARGAQQIWLFGSLARGDATATSDIDLAVLGLPSSAYFDALAELMLLFGVRVDLVRLEEAGTSLRACVHEEGRSL